MSTQPLNPAESTANTRVRTLVVDDSPFMLKILAQTLEQAGSFDLIGTATDGCQALRYASALSPDLVLMDFHMPHLNGIEATRLIKDCEHPPVVLIITSDDSSVAKSMAEQAGADGFIVKSGSLSLRLTRALQDLFGARGASRAGVAGGRFQNPPIPRATHEHGV